MARGLKFRILVVEGLYDPFSENKGADLLRGYREADLRLKGRGGLLVNTSNSESRGRGFEPHLGCRVVSLSKTYLPPPKKKKKKKYW